jgi:DNA primase
MFPLADASGRIVGFSGRFYPEDTEMAGDNRAPKYLNSPETEVFQKSRILYCFDKAKTLIRQAGFAILVEGQMDALLAHQNGFRNTVATSGTAVSETMAQDLTSNLSVIARLTPHLFLAFDGDKAGQKALDRAALVALTLGMNPKVVPLPEGVDPADFLLTEGKEKWKELLQHSQHFILHELAMIHQKALSPHLLVQKIKERVFPFLARVASPVEQKLYIEAIAKDIAVSADEVLKELALFVSSTPVQSTPSAVEPRREGDISIAERFIALATRFPSEIIAREEASLRTLSFDQEAFVFPEIDEQKLSVVMATIERDYATLDASARDKLAVELAEKIRTMFFSTIRSAYAQKLAIAERAGDDGQMSVLLGKLQELNRTRHQDQSGTD